jgi:hypothetical protein
MTHVRSSMLAPVATAVAAVAGLATLAVGISAAAAATNHKAHAAPKLALVAHHTFWECPSKTTLVLVDISTLTLHPGQTESINFIVRNEGTVPCNYVAPYVSGYTGSGTPPTSTALQSGPCGSVAFQVENTHHHDVYPGTRVFNCPALGFAELAPNSTVSGSGSWSQTGASGSGRVPDGNYTLLVDGHFSFPLKLDAH